MVPTLPTHPSVRVYEPHHGLLSPVRLSSTGAAVKDPRAEGWISALLNQKNYPCVAALQSFHKDDYQVGFYDRLGVGKTWREMRQDLLFFLSKQKQSKSTHLTFWALFKEEPQMDEATFEQRMWHELSHLTSEETKAEDWGEFTSDPEDKAFCLGLGGHRFFVVGLHPQSSRKARQFPVPALVFNVFDQFETLKAKGIYDPMVKTNRDRDVKFQGNVNPMALIHGDDWESIQFSGRTNDEKKWKCPFSFMKSFMKP